MKSHGLKGGSIVIAVPDYLPSLGGTTRQSQNQAKSCDAWGIKPIILTQRIDRSWPRRELVDGVEVVRIGPSSRGKLAMKIFVFNSAIWMRRNRAQIALVNAVMYPDLAVGARLAGFRHRTIICWAGLGDATDALGERGNFLRRTMVRMRRRLLRDVSHVVLTDALAQELSALGITEHVHPIPTQVDSDQFRPPTPTEREATRDALRLSDEEVAVIYVGHVRELKRIDLLIEGFASSYANDQRLRMYIVGGSRDDLEDRTQQLTALSISLGLKDVVEFVGQVDDVRRYLHAADIFVLPSEREGLSNSVIEAMATGLACVVPISASGDQILTSRTGIVPETNSAVELATAISSLVTDPELRRSLGEAAAVESLRYSVQAVGEMYRSLYESLWRA